MKRHLSAIAIAMGLAFGACSALAADSISITQDGTGNTIDASQAGNSAAGARAITIQQDGDTNEITVSQKNLQGVANASVNQTGSYHIAKISQSDSTDVRASITQNNMGSYASISQTNVNNATAEINQIRGGGVASIVQKNGSTDVNATITNNSANMGYVTQSNVNVGRAIIDGQNGAANGTSISQHDGHHLVASISISPGTVRQNHAGISQTGSFQTASLVQGDGLSDSRADISQDGTQNDADILQSGGIVSRADISQTGLGGLNAARLSQHGSDQHATITQNGSNFRANLNQSGSSNTAAISQHF